MGKVTCTQCNALILEATAITNGGLCMPCTKLKNNLATLEPNIIAYNISAIVLFVNAATSATLFLQAALPTLFIISILIDSVLSFILFKQKPKARLFGLIRAILGLVVLSLIIIANGFSNVVPEALAAQLSFNGTLIIMLGWQTVYWRMFVGSVLATIFTIYCIMLLYTNAAL